MLGFVIQLHYKRTNSKFSLEDQTPKLQFLTVLFLFYKWPKAGKWTENIMSGTLDTAAGTLEMFYVTIKVELSA